MAKDKSFSDEVKKELADIATRRQDAQFARGDVLEKALKTYEKNIRIRSIRDYIEASKHQRLLYNMNTDKQELTGAVRLITNVKDED